MLVQPPVAEPVKVETLDEYTLAIETRTNPVLVQFGSPNCPRCGPFSDAAKALAEEYQFERIYVNTPDAPELVEEFEVARLPAFALVIPGSEDDIDVVQAADRDMLTMAITSACTPKLKLDEDF